jgi:hypothetical protein
MLMPMGSKLARFEGAIVAQCTRTTSARVGAGNAVQAFDLQRS